MYVRITDTSGAHHAPILLHVALRADLVPAVTVRHAAANQQVDVWADTDQPPTPAGRATPTPDPRP